jgi:hypothetical protein
MKAEPWQVRRAAYLAEKADAELEAKILEETTPGFDRKAAIKRIRKENLQLAVRNLLEKGHAKDRP